MYINSIKLMSIQPIPKIFFRFSTPQFLSEKLFLASLYHYSSVGTSAIDPIFPEFLSAIDNYFCVENFI